MKKSFNNVAELQQNFMETVNEIVNDYRTNSNNTSSIYIDGKRYIIGKGTLTNGNKGFTAWKAEEDYKYTIIEEFGNSKSKMPNTEIAIIKLVSAVIKAVKAEEANDDDNSDDDNNAEVNTVTEAKEINNSNKINNDNNNSNKINNDMETKLEKQEIEKQVEFDAPSLNGSINMWAPELDGITKEIVDAMSDDDKDEWIMNLQNYTIDEITGAIANRKNDNQCVVNFDTNAVYGLSEYMPDWGDDVAWMAEEFDLDVTDTEWVENGKNSKLIIYFAHNDNDSVYDYIDETPKDIRDYAKSIKEDWDLAGDKAITLKGVDWYDNVPFFGSYIDDDGDRWITLSNSEDQFNEEVYLEYGWSDFDLIDALEGLAEEFVDYFKTIKKETVAKCEEEGSCCVNDWWIC